ncbi:hypothetical protein BDU57DRAFT_37577 [Ampelomyces quisqualis]|uniref:Fungal N-terminal domain-containing protein n=1 Tax=Ampelomyces quisqualis TaxID=50730 RepID=A0A6A5QZA7_AMPQU|nr:hypothetical protein BDU57DRAFT_37577 [Ampelomyces quisqualis]
MEVLSGVASGIAVASLSLQLLQSINTIRTFVRGVKGAPKELQRLAALLDRLHALLETIRDMLERQTSLQAQDFPPPSPIILETLRSCKSSIEPLCLIVDEYSAGRQGKTLSLTRLKDDIRLGLKTKDIAGFEEKIRSEIEYLHTALSVNSTSIL